MLLSNNTLIASTFSPIKSGYDESDLTLSVTIILSIFIVVTILGNSLVCFAFYKQPQLRKVCYYPIISLAIADLLCGAVAMPAYIAKKHVDDGGWQEGVVCDVFRFSYFFTEYASILSLTAISIERFIAIKMPVKHKTWLSVRKITAALIFSWLDAALVSVLPFFWRRNEEDELCQFDPTKEWSMMVILVNVFLPFLIMLSCHFYTVSYAIRYTRRSVISKRTFKPKAQQLSTTDEGRSLKSIKRERDITRTFALVVGIFILCWGPSSFYYFIRMVCPKCYGASFKKIKQIFNAVVKLMTFMNSCLNPLIYFCLNPALREAFIVTLIGKKAARQRRRDELSTFNRSISPTTPSINPLKCKNMFEMQDSDDS